MKIHHDKHHAKYIATTTTMIAKTELEGADLVTILRKAYGTNQALFNNAAQSWNHTFYWYCMKPNGGGLPSGKLLDLIVKYFGSFEKFRDEFMNAGLSAFGSGWYVFINVNFTYLLDLNLYTFIILGLGLCGHQLGLK
jgi:Fe-Mn family superoxide dismutase